MEAAHCLAKVNKQKLTILNLTLFLKSQILLPSEKKKGGGEPKLAQICTSLSCCLKILSKFWIYKTFFDKSNRV